MTQEKLIVALDVPDVAAAKALVEKLGDEVIFYKIGLELMMSGEYFELLKWLKGKGKKIFADLKIYDISETVGRAIKNLQKYEIDLLTIHTASHDIMLKAAENKGSTKIIGVTVLTNIDEKDLLEMGFSKEYPLKSLVINKTAKALECGLDGVVASALEAKMLREAFGKDFLIVSPGIRLEAIANDDQKRVADVKTALENGCSYLVVGRPITRAADPQAAAKKFNQLIDDFS